MVLPIDVKHCNLISSEEISNHLQGGSPHHLEWGWIRENRIVWSLTVQKILEGVFAVQRMITWKERGFWVSMTWGSIEKEEFDPGVINRELSFSEHPDDEFILIVSIMPGDTIPASSARVI